MRVRGDGRIPCDLMFIGEAPGYTEALYGLPFVGRAGQNLTRLLSMIGVDRYKDCYLTNVVKERPPANRDPTPEEIARDEDELRGEISMVAPYVIIPLGRIAASWIMGASCSISQVHAVARVIDSRVVFPLYHPAAMLHDPLRTVDTEYGFRRLGKLLRGGRVGRMLIKDKYPEPQYNLYEHEDAPIELITPTLLQHGVMAVSYLEGVGFGYSLAAGSGQTVLLVGPESGIWWLRYLASNVSEVVFRDAAVIEALGPSRGYVNLTDLMIEKLGAFDFHRELHRRCGMWLEDLSKLPAGLPPVMTEYLLASEADGIMRLRDEIVK